jgi:hypothetical protein
MSKMKPLKLPNLKDLRFISSAEPLVLSVAEGSR